MKIQKSNLTFIAIIFTLIATTPCLGDLFSDIHISTDEDAYVNININTSGNLNTSTTWNRNEYYTTVSNNGYSEKRMFNDMAEAIDHYIGYDKMSFVEPYHNRFFASQSRLIIAMYEQVYEQYYHKISQEIRAQRYAIIDLEKRVIELEEKHDITSNKDISVLCEGWIKVMSEDNESKITCQNGHGPEIWHDMNIGSDNGAIRLTQIN